jgi:hypothetical protein
MAGDGRWDLRPPGILSVQLPEGRMTKPAIAGLYLAFIHNFTAGFVFLQRKSRRKESSHPCQAYIGSCEFGLTISQ